MKRKLLLIGYDIDHSLSPQLHRVWLKKHKLLEQFEYGKIDTIDFNIGFVEKAYGYSVTSPFKHVAFLKAKNTDRYSKISKSCNTLKKINNSDQYLGYNTDVQAILHCLNSYGNLEIKPIIFGNGFTVNSILTALYIKKITSKIFIYCRKIKDDIYDNFRELLDIKQLPLTSNMVNKENSVIFNTIPMIDVEILKKNLKPNSLFFEYTYQKWPSLSLSIIRKYMNNQDIKFISPFKLLILQGMVQFKIFTDFEGKNTSFNL